MEKHDVGFTGRWEGTGNGLERAQEHLPPPSPTPVHHHFHLCQVGSYNYNYADVTLESYNITTCAQLPTGATDFSELHLTVTEEDTPWVPAMWYVTGQPTNCDTAMEVSSPTAMSIRTK